MTVDNKYSLLLRDNYCNIFRCNYIRNEKLFLIFFFAFSRFTFNKFWISLGETFSKWIVFTGVNKYSKGAIVHFSTLIRTIYYVTFQRSSETDILDIYLTMFFGVRKFKNIWAIKITLSLKAFKMESKFRKCKKNRENIFRFCDYCIWKCCYKMSLLRRE